MSSQVLDSKTIMNNDMIIGCLLGDATIDKFYGGQNSRFVISQSPKYYDLIYDVRNKLNELGFNSTLLTRKNVGYAKNDIIQLQSSRNKIFTEMRKIWYPDNKKLIPRDLKLTPKIIAYWFMCDGSTKWVQDRTLLGLATDGFKHEDVYFLNDKLLELDLKTHVTNDNTHGTKRINSVKSSEVIKFLECVDEYILPCFRYKMKYPIVTSKAVAHLKRKRVNGRFAPN